MTAKEHGDARRIDVLFGHTELQSRFRRDGLRFIGEGRALHYDGDRKLTKDTGWRPTGIEVIAPDARTAMQVECWNRAFHRPR